VSEMTVTVRALQRIWGKND